MIKKLKLFLWLFAMTPTYFLKELVRKSNELDGYVKFDKVGMAKVIVNYAKDMPKTICIRQSKRPGFMGAPLPIGNKTTTVIRIPKGVKVWVNA